VRLVLDTSVLVAAFRSRTGGSRRLLNFALQRRFYVIATTNLYFEYETVLKRSVHAEVHRYTDDEIDRFLLVFSGFVEKPTIHFQVRPQLFDPNDEMVLDAAVNGRAEAIVTHNVSDFLPAAKDFGIQVMTPGSILKERFRDE
jgi:putative PIN family toxin of toxin-antitoxin system